MPKYLIERSIPGAGSLDRDELRAASQNSCNVLRELGPTIQWVQSYVTDDKITCVYIAPSEEMIREHARRAGLPADAVMEIRTIIDPTTAEPERAPTKAAGMARSLALALAGLLSAGAMACTPSGVDVDVVAPEGEPVVTPIAGQSASPATQIASSAAESTSPAAQPADPGVATDLAALRRVVAPLHSFDAAQEAGWTHLIPRCRDNQPAGGMGWHYANPAYVDGELDVTKPEALIYEPQEDGSMTFVGVEFAVPFSELPPEAEAPRLFGQSFLHNLGDELWMLHVWVGRHNPAGMFATWNPRVSCQHAR